MSANPLFDVLNHRQRRAYKDTMTIIRANKAVGAGGKPGATTYSIYKRGVPCMYQSTPNVNASLQGAGRDQPDQIFSTDIWHFHQSVRIRENDYLYCTSTLPDGSTHPNFGKVWRPRGDNRVIARAGGRKADKISVMSMVVQQPPEDVIALVEA